MSGTYLLEYTVHSCQVKYNQYIYYTVNSATRQYLFYN